MKIDTRRQETRADAARKENPLRQVGADAEKLRAMFTPAQREAAANFLAAMSDSYRARGEMFWANGKAPLALYWRAVGVYCGHFARLFRGRRKK